MIVGHTPPLSWVRPTLTPLSAPDMYQGQAHLLLALVVQRAQAGTRGEVPHFGLTQLGACTGERGVQGGVGIKGDVQGVGCTGMRCKGVECTGMGGVQGAERTQVEGCKGTQGRVAQQDKGMMGNSSA